MPVVINPRSIGCKKHGDKYYIRNANGAADCGICRNERQRDKYWESKGGRRPTIQVRLHNERGQIVPSTGAVISATCKCGKSRPVMEGTRVWVCVCGVRNEVK